jgi:hypothetical protein
MTAFRHAFVSAYLSLARRTRSFARFSFILAARHHRDQRQVLLPLASTYVPEPHSFAMDLQGENRLVSALLLFVFVTVASSPSSSARPAAP